jgi:hypothetical protein
MFVQNTYKHVHMEVHIYSNVFVFLQVHLYNFLLIVTCSFKILINMFIFAFVFYVRNFLFVQCRY